MRVKYDAEMLELEYTRIAPPSCFAVLFSKVQLETEAVLFSNSTKAPPIVLAVFRWNELQEIVPLVLRCIRIAPPDSPSFS